ncbi:MAG: DUF1818 family protein [Leptolyngbyaceae bacterium]|nr:DUF1818 family protein [Leptolyngbyaceae bacterium]
MVQHIKSGEGWRIGWDDEAEVYRGLIGGDRWSVELTEAEFQDFCQLLGTLDETIQHLASELMDEETICCETESEHIWLEAEGYPNSYTVHVMTQHGRRTEGEWPASVIPDLLQATQIITVF